MKKSTIIFLLIKLLFLNHLSITNLFSNNFDFEFAVLKYKGGGDWYEGQVGVKNLMKFLKKNTSINPNPKAIIVEPDDSDLANHPFIYATGHGNISFTPNEIIYFRNYLLSGGFFYINDDFGMDKSVRKLIKKLFPSKKMVELPVTHPLFNIYYSFPSGAPKIHEHDGGRPKIFAIFHHKRIILLYSFDTDIGDGWAPYQVHKDPKELRIKALKFGVNIILFSMSE